MIREIVQLVGYVINFQLYKGDNVDIKVSTVLTIGVLFLTIHLILKGVKRFISRNLPENDSAKFDSIFIFVRYFIFIIFFLFVLSMVGVNINVFLTASAALFVGLGFALQQLFQDLIAGMYMILDKSLHVGDVIEVDNKICKVRSIHLRSTRAITRDDRMLIIPNHKFITDVIFNWTQSGEVVRTQIEVGVYIGSDLELVRYVLYQAALSVPDVLETPCPVIMVDKFGESSVRFLLHFYLSNSFENERICSEVRFAVYAYFKDHNIQLPVPVITLLDSAVINKINEFKF